MQIKFSIRLLIALILLLWTAGIFSSCLVSLNDYIIAFYPFFKKTYSLVCHQESSKLIVNVCGNSLVCARCAGIYSGLLTTSIIFIFHPLKNIPDIKLLLFSSIPMLLDVLLTTIHIYPYFKTLAFLTGILFGSILFLYFYRGLILLFEEIYSKGTK